MSKNNNQKQFLKKAVPLFCALFLLFLAEGSVHSEEMCEVDTDAVIIMDISGSMNEGERRSKCEWPEAKWYEEEGFYTWFRNVKYDVSKEWCEEEMSDPDESIITYSRTDHNYTPARSTKIVDAKEAADNFLGHFQESDHSALVSFNEKADLKKELSGDHSLTRSFLEKLTAEGSTNIGDAIKKGNEELSSPRAREEATKVMILLTDGKANKPHGPGHGEYQEDVDYALGKAQIAAQMGYKIFTIGLGEKEEINEEMLQEIADLTGANYYHAPEGKDLKEIYETIAWEICRYGAISGYKYLDEELDGMVGEEDKALPGWEIILEGPVSAATTTNEEGFYVFTGLLPGEYKILEGENEEKRPFLQTYPEELFHKVSLDYGKNKEELNFGNADSSLCQKKEISSICIDDGSREIFYSYNHDYCGEDHSIVIEDDTCKKEETSVKRSRGSTRTAPAPKEEEEEEKEEEEEEEEVFEPEPEEEETPPEERIVRMPTEVPAGITKKTLSYSKPQDHSVSPFSFALEYWEKTLSSSFLNPLKNRSYLQEFFTAILIKNERRFFEEVFVNGNLVQ